MLVSYLSDSFTVPKDATDRLQSYDLTKKSVDPPGSLVHDYSVPGAIPPSPGNYGKGGQHYQVQPDGSLKEIDEDIAQKAAATGIHDFSVSKAQDARDASKGAGAPGTPGASGSGAPGSSDAAAAMPWWQSTPVLVGGGLFVFLLLLSSKKRKPKKSVKDTEK